MQMLEVIKKIVFIEGSSFRRRWYTPTQYHTESTEERNGSKCSTVRGNIRGASYTLLTLFAHA